MNENIQYNSEDISFKEFIQKLKDWYKYILKKWMIIALCGLIGGIFGFYYASSKKVTYTAKLTFVLEEGKGGASGIGGLASLAGQFGVDIGGATSSSGLLSGDNILVYFKSPSLAREVLLSKYDSSSNLSIADVYAKVYQLTKGWAENRNIGNVKFPVLTPNTKYSRLQDSLLQGLINSIIVTKFNVARTDKKAGFIDVTTTMQDELLSKVYCERIVQKVVERYINVKTQRQNAIVKKLQMRVDSIASLLATKTFSGAALQNSANTMDINPLYRTNQNVSVETILRDKALLLSIYTTVSQNLEMAKFSLSQETPVIQVVDAPILPLKKEKMSRLTTALLGSFISSVLISIFLILRRLYSQIVMG